MIVTRRAPFRVVFAALLAAAMAALTVAPAHAVSYRFWGFYQLVEGKWAFAQKGPDQITPADGTVDGWRFAIADVSATRYPRAVLTFDEICATTPAQDGRKRVAVVVDFGRIVDAEGGATPPEPRAVCALVTKDSTSTDVLRTVGELRMETGLLCGVAGYPAAGCGGQVKQVSAEAKAADTPVQIAVQSVTQTLPTPTTATSSTTSPTPTAAGTNVPGTPTAGTSSGTSTAAYIIAGLGLLALIGFLVARSRAAARRDS